MVHERLITYRTASGPGKGIQAVEVVDFCERMQLHVPESRRLCYCNDKGLKDEQYKPLVGDLEVRLDLVGSLRHAVHDADSDGFVDTQPKEGDLSVSFLLQLLLEGQQPTTLIHHLGV